MIYLNFGSAFLQIFVMLPEGPVWCNTCARSKQYYRTTEISRQMKADTSKQRIRWKYFHSVKI